MEKSISVQRTMSSLALLHHVGEMALDIGNAPRKYKLLIDGIGVGWALFWLIKLFFGKPEMVETKSVV